MKSRMAEFTRTFPNLLKLAVDWVVRIIHDVGLR